MKKNNSVGLYILAASLGIAANVRAEEIMAKKARLKKMKFHTVPKEPTARSRTKSVLWSVAR